eukprot:CAMPEP_0177534698 /NCGR_PEP_ID=MMETSP0369-20130122/56107_1 /TAXON_ID=447022 ORGANISM="Scrippsiella hangoei-like, Strain SHHI-4" /NCGR_SAMPLE_ID=MMETSP0369 /ASSEMBLY_ACC=CAM_ASM_000364 /LENGTH=34 /DNA_ID= /DNA_START= /DNA_END= /DNA_ORIENTATION=
MTENELERNWELQDLRLAQALAPPKSSCSTRITA